MSGRHAKPHGAVVLGRSLTQQMEARRIPLFAPARSAWSDPMLRSAFALLLNQVTGAGAGFLLTVVATHLYSASNLGVATAALSTLVLVGSLSGLGLGYSVVRMLPTAENHDAMLDTCTTIASIAAVFVATVFLLTPGSDGILRVGGRLIVPALLLGAVLANLQVVAEAACVADRSAWTLLRANAVSSVLRMVLLFALLPVGGLAAYWAQLGAWALAVVILLRRLRTVTGYRPSWQINHRAVSVLWRFSLGNYLSALVGGIPLALRPLIILSRFGTASVTYWYVAYSIASLLFTLPSMVCRSMLAEGSYRESGRIALLRRGERSYRSWLSRS